MLCFVGASEEAVLVRLRLHSLPRELASDVRNGRRSPQLQVRHVFRILPILNKRHKPHAQVE